MSEKTKLTIHIHEGSRTELPLVFKQTATSGVRVDWGDEDDIETFADAGLVELRHRYENDGVYEIMLEPVEDCSIELGGLQVNKGLFGESSGYRSALKSAVIGTNVSIGRYAFRGCCNLETVSFTETFCEIGEYAFDGCYALEKISIPQYNAELRAGTFFNCVSLKEVELPDGLVNIWHHAFYNCCTLPSINLEHVEDIGACAFASCKLLENIRLNKNLHDLGTYAFEGCVSLTEVELPESLSVVPEFAFFGCAGLEYVALPTSAKRIASGAFGNCCFAKTFVLNREEPPVLSDISAFDGIPEDCVMLVHETSAEKYKAATNWVAYAEHMEVLV